MELGRTVTARTLSALGVTPFGTRFQRRFVLARCAMSLAAPLLLTVFGLLAAALVARHRAVRFGLELGDLHSLMRWLVIGGLVGGHLVDVLCFRSNQQADAVQWELIWRQPLELLRVWHGWRSVGGLFGGLSAALLWKRYRFEPIVVTRLDGIFELESYWFVRRAQPVPLLALGDVVVSVFPLAWALHRVGSALALDRNEVGLLDLVITTALLVVVVMLWKGRFRAGTYICLAGLTYAPARVLLGFLGRRATRAPSLLSSLTLTQGGFAAATLLSLALLVWMRWTVDPQAGAS
jgi:prolipoprotein diacylglyceryltransferase